MFNNHIKLAFRQHLKQQSYAMIPIMGDTSGSKIKKDLKKLLP